MMLINNYILYISDLVLRQRLVEEHINTAPRPAAGGEVNKTFCKHPIHIQYHSLDPVGDHEEYLDG